MKINLRSIFLLIVSAGLLLAQDLDSKLSSGMKKLNEGDLKGAETLFQEIIDQNPTYAPAIFQLGQLHIRLGNMEKAQTLMRQVVELDYEKYNEEFERLNEINTLMNDGARSMKGGRFDEAFDSYQIVLEKFPFFAEAAYSMGLAKFRAKDFDVAVEYFHKALELNPYHENTKAAIANVAKNTFNEGNNAYRRGDLEGAMTAYRKVLEIDNQFYQAHYQTGVIQAKMRNLSGAIEAYEKALEINPDFYKGWFALGLAKKKNGEIEGAIQSLEKAVEVNAGYAKAYGSMGDIYLETKEYDKALNVLKTAIQVDGSYAKAYVTLGIVYSEMNQFEEAISNLEIGTSLNPKNDKAWFRLAHAYNELQDCENAKRAAREATERKKNFGGGWFELGLAEWCNGKGNKTAALNAYEKARNDRTWRKMAEYEIDRIKNPHKYID